MVPASSTVCVVSATDEHVTTAYNTVDYTLDQSLLSLSYFSLDNTGQVHLAASVASLTGGTTLTCTLYVNNTGYSVGDTATMYVNITEVDSDDFWDKGANIAWVTLTILGVAALSACLACKFWPGADDSNLIRKVKPVETTK